MSVPKSGGSAHQTLRLVHTSRLAEPPTTVATSAAAPLAIAGDDVYFTGPDRLFVAGLTASIDPQAQAEGAVWTLAR